MAPTPAGHRLHWAGNGHILGSSLFRYGDAARLAAAWGPGMTIPQSHCRNFVPGWLAAFAGLALLAGCEQPPDKAAKAPPAPPLAAAVPAAAAATPPPAPRPVPRDWTLVFFDSDVFDIDFAAALKGGPNEVRAAFTPGGWSLIQAALRSGEIKADDDPCLSSLIGSEGNRLPADSGLAQRIEDRYVRDYIVAWQRYLTQFSVIGYGGFADATRKLTQLEAYKSPLLALFALTADNTSFQTAQPGGQFQDVPIIGSMLSNAGKQAAKSCRECGQHGRFLASQ